MSATPIMPSVAVCTCTLCGKAFETTALGVPIIGETPDKKVLRFMNRLGQHIADQHQPEMIAAQILSSEFMALLLMGRFLTADLEFQKAIEKIRAHVHKVTRKVFVSDAAIADKLAGITQELNVEGNYRDLCDCDDVSALLTELRDVFMEGEPTPPTI